MPRSVEEPLHATKVDYWVGLDDGRLQRYFECELEPESVLNALVCGFQLDDGNYVDIQVNVNGVEVYAEDLDDALEQLAAAAQHLRLLIDRASDERRRRSLRRVQ